MIEGLNFRTCRSVHMCDCHNFVLLGSKRLLDLRYIDSPAKVCMQLIDLGSIRLKAKVNNVIIQDSGETKSICVPICKAIAEISRVEYQSAFSRLYEVGRNLTFIISW